MRSDVIGVIAGCFATLIGFMDHNGYIILFGLLTIVLSLLYSKDLKAKISKNIVEKELIKNKELFDKGILTEDEYTVKMKELKSKL